MFTLSSLTCVCAATLFLASLGPTVELDTRPANPSRAGLKALPVTKNVTLPAEWAMECVVVSSIQDCLGKINPNSSLRTTFFTHRKLQELSTVNQAVNRMTLAYSLEEAIWAAIAKKRLLEEEGWPSNSLTFAEVVREVEDPDHGGNLISVPHLVLLVHFNTTAGVLDILSPIIHPWEDSPHYFYSIRLPNGEWRAVADDRKELPIGWNQ